MNMVTKIEKWRELLGEMQADASRVAHNQRVDQQRQQVIAEIQMLLERFQSGDCSSTKLRSEFDSRTRNEWDVFGFKGMSGAMFLNKLVKYLPSDSLEPALKAVMLAPADEAQAIQRMRAFADFLEAKIKTGVATRSQLQPARLAFLISGCWHIQQKDQWPIFYVSARTTLQTENLLEESGDSVNDYFSYYSAFNSLAAALEIDVWTCEHLLDWMNQREPADLKRKKIDRLDDDEVVIEEEVGTHAHVQWLLARMGRKLGCQVWVANNDQSKEYNGERLGEHCIESLPNLGLDSYSQRVINLIDVVWIKGANQIAAAFEIEHTTSIFSGLLRMSDLVSLSPNLNFPLFIVAPEVRMQKVANELSRPTFQMLELHKRCGYFSDETLIEKADEIMRWASDSSAIQRLASYAPDTVLQ